MTITPRTSPTPLPPPPPVVIVPVWTVDANEGAAAGDPASAGRAVVVIQGPAMPDYTAELEIYVPHTYEQ
jgi:hypothetical protein